MKFVSKTLAALGFACFFSLAFLPVGMAVCEPAAGRLFHQAKKNRHHASAPATPKVAAVQPLRVVRDAISEADPLPAPWEHLPAARNAAGSEQDDPKFRVHQGDAESAKLSSFVFHTVLIL